MGCYLMNPGYNGQIAFEICFIYRRRGDIGGDIDGDDSNTMGKMYPWHPPRQQRGGDNKGGNAQAAIIGTF